MKKFIFFCNFPIILFFSFCLKSNCCLNETICKWFSDEIFKNQNFSAQIMDENNPFYIVKPYNLHLSLNENPTGKIMVFDKDGKKVTSGLEFFGYDSALIKISSNGTVTALRQEKDNEIGTWVYVYVNNYPANNSCVVRVLSKEVEATWIEDKGKYTTLFSPAILKGEDLHCYVEEYQIPLVNDYAYQDQWNITGVKAFRGKQVFEVDFGESEKSRVCGISGNPIRLGWNLNGDAWQNCFLVPFSPPRSPQWMVFYHELGHNTTLPSYTFVNSVGPVINYSEALATYISLISIRRIPENSDIYYLTSSAISALQEDYQRKVDSYIDSFQKWIKAGAMFNEINPDIVDGLLFTLEGSSPECFSTRFFKVFHPFFLDQLRSLVNSIKTEAQRHTFFAALCSFAAQKDLSSDFSQKYNFEIESSFFSNAYDTFNKLIGLDIPKIESPIFHPEDTSAPLKLKWQGPPGTISYNLYLGTSKDKMILKASNILAQEYDLLNICANTTYYFKVVANHPCLGTLTSEIGEFETDSSFSTHCRPF